MKLRHLFTSLISLLLLTSIILLVVLALDERTERIPEENRTESLEKIPDEASKEYSEAPPINTPSEIPEKAPDEVSNEPLDEVQEVNLDESLEDYTVTIVSFTENGSYAEYPQIDGLSDKDKQDAINELLKEQIYVGAKNFMGETVVDFSDPETTFEFECTIGLINKHIASFSYYFDAYSKVEFGMKGYINRFICITIDMETGKKIELSDLMVIDDRLLNSNDGDDTEPDYDSPVNPTFHSFKDAFEIYFTEEEKDSFHWQSVQSTIESLSNPDGETNWCISKDKNLVFKFIHNYICIPYTHVYDAIYPKYQAILDYEP